MGQVKAIDISYAQPQVDYKAVKSGGINAIIARNGYLGRTDTMFDIHAKGAIEAGLDIGTYTYIMSNTPAEARREASETVKRLEKYKGGINYPVFADMEDSKYMTSKFDKTTRTNILLEFLKVIESEGYYAAVYINPAWLETYIDKSKIVGKYDIWLAAWTESPSKLTKFNYGQTMWQWGVSLVPGINGKVDSDLVYVDYPKTIRAGGKNYLQVNEPVTLAFDAAIRSKPEASAEKLGLLTLGTKCVIVKGSDTLDPVSRYTYVKLAGGKDQWIVKSAIKQ